MTLNPELALKPELTLNQSLCSDSLEKVRCLCSEYCNPINLQLNIYFMIFFILMIIDIFFLEWYFEKGYKRFNIFNDDRMDDINTRIRYSYAIRGWLIRFIAGFWFIYMWFFMRL